MYDDKIPHKDVFYIAHDQMIKQRQWYTEKAERAAQRKYYEQELRKRVQIPVYRAPVVDPYSHLHTVYAEARYNSPKSSARFLKLNPSQTSTGIYRGDSIKRLYV